MCNLLRKLIITCGILCISAGVFAQSTVTFSPTDDDGNGEISVYFRILNGDKAYLGTGSLPVIYLPPANDGIDYFVFGNTTNSFNIGVGIAESDFTVSTFNGNTYYSGASIVNYPMIQKYIVSMTGESDKTLNALAAPSLSSANFLIKREDYTPGIYTKTVTVQDIGELPSNGAGSVRDANAGNSTNLYYVDFIVPGKSEVLTRSGVSLIDLAFTPDSFPHGNICYLSVSWGMMAMPGMASNLYYDQECQHPIASNLGSYSAEIRWKIGTDTIPDRIYFKYPATGTPSGITVKITAIQGSNTITISQKSLTFSLSDFQPKEVVYQSVFKGYWTGSETTYPMTKWFDYNEDGVAVDPIGTSSNELNRPMVFKNGTNFFLNMVTFKKNTAITLPLINTLNVVSSDGVLDKNNLSFTSSSNLLTVLNITGNPLPAIGVKNTVLSWTLNGKNIGKTDHKIYIVGGDPSNDSYHTLIDIGCTAASGLVNDNTGTSQQIAAKKQAIFNRICGEFSSLTIQRIDGGQNLKYWGEISRKEENEITPNDGYTYPEFFVTSGLLKNRDGRCGAWAKLFLSTLEIQGLLGNLIAIVPKTTIIHNGHPDQIRHIKQVNCSFQGGVTDPPTNFGDHAIVSYGNNQYYDPSNGIGPCTIEYYLENYLEVNFYCSVSENILSQKAKDPDTENQTGEFHVTYN